MGRRITMKRVLRISQAVLLSVSIAFSQAYRPENKAKVIFHVKVTRNSIPGFIYTCDIKNDTSSEGVCDGFTLFLGDSSLTTPRSQIASPKNKKWYISGITKGSVSGSPATRFLDIPPANGLAPGESMTISFKSSGLPSIMLYYAQSFAPPLTEEEFDSLLNAGYTRSQLLPNWKDNSYCNQTIAPNTGLLGLQLLSLIDTLSSYKQQSLKLGWLIDDKTRKHDCDDIMRDKEWYKKSDFWKHGEWDNDETWDFDHDWDTGLVKVLDRRLEKARRVLMQNDSIRARKELETFVMEVELINDMSGKVGKRDQSDRESLREGPLSGKPVMTSEAYALLKYNAEYLIDRLPDRHGRVNKGDDRRK